MKLTLTGTNYLGLAHSYEGKVAAVRAIEDHGLSFSASRATTGTHPLHTKLETQLSRFMNTEESCVVGSGSEANRVAVEALKTKHRIKNYFVLPKTHPSLVGAIPHHAKVHELSLKAMTIQSDQAAIVLMHTVDPVTGEIPNLVDLIQLLNTNPSSFAVVDDAHGSFVLGPNGRGTLDYLGLQHPRIFTTGVLSKALGSHGGFIASTHEFCQAIRKTSAYIGATALPPASTAAALANLELIQDQGIELRQHLFELGKTTAALINSTTRFRTQHFGSPILCLTPPDDLNAEEVSQRLAEKQVDLACIRYPTAESPMRLRIALNALLTSDEIEQLIAALAWF